MADDKDKPAMFLGVDGNYWPEGYIYSVDRTYHHPSLFYRPGTNKQGEHHNYRADSSPLGLDGYYGAPGSFLGVDGKRHPEGSVYGVDGQYHDPPPPRG